MSVFKNRDRLDNLCLKSKINHLCSISNISEIISFDFSKMNSYEIYFFKIFSAYLGVTGIFIPYNSIEWRATTVLNNQGLTLILNKVKNTLAFFGNIDRISSIEIYENVI